MADPTEFFKLSKSTWTQDDFEEMGWHDANIYGLSIEQNEDDGSSDLLLDMDYIFKWVYPQPPAQTFTFWVAPCTLIFRNCYDLRIDFKTDGSALNLMEIADLYLSSKVEQETNRFVYEWHIELQQGTIALRSYGFEQIVRKYPMHVNTQVLLPEQRGGIHFGRTPCTTDK